jgi:hypothetical protein
MRAPKHHLQLPTWYFRSECSHCPTCQTFLRRATLLSRRTSITLVGPSHYRWSLFLFCDRRESAPQPPTWYPLGQWKDAAVHGREEPTMWWANATRPRQGPMAALPSTGSTTPSIDRALTYRAAYQARRCQPDKDSPCRPALVRRCSRPQWRLTDEGSDAVASCLGSPLLPKPAPNGAPQFVPPGSLRWQADGDADAEADVRDPAHTLLCPKVRPSPTVKGGRPGS